MPVSIPAEFDDCIRELRAFVSAAIERRAVVSFLMPKPKSKDSPFAFVRGLFGRTESPKPSELRVEQHKADEEVLDRVASLNLSIAETLAPLAVATQNPNLVNAVLGASREARACVEARKDVTGGGLAGGTQTGQSVTVRIEHSGEYVSDDFHDFKAPSSGGGESRPSRRTGLV